MESFYAYLLNFDTSWFNESKRPLETQARVDLKRLGSDSAIRFIEDWTSGNINLPVGPAVLGHLYDAYTIWCKSSGERPCSKEVFGGRCKSRLNGGRLRVQLYSEDSSSTETLRPLKIYHRQVYWPKARKIRKSMLNSLSVLGRFRLAWKPPKKGSIVTSSLSSKPFSYLFARSCSCFRPQGLLFSPLFILFTLFRGTKWTV